MISLVSRFSPDIQQGFYALQRAVAINPVEQKLVNNLKSLQSDNLKLSSVNKKSEKTSAKDKPKTIQQPAKTNNEMNAPYGLAHLRAAGGISKKNAISNSTSPLFAIGDKTKTSSAVTDSHAAKLRNADLLRKAAPDPAAPLSKQAAEDATAYAKTQADDDHKKMDVSAVAEDPATTLRKADIIREATPTPAQPSSQDIQDAAKAQVELLKQNQDTQIDAKNYLGSKIDLSA